MWANHLQLTTVSHAVDQPCHRWLPTAAVPVAVVQIHWHRLFMATAACNQQHMLLVLLALCCLLTAAAAARTAEAPNLPSELKTAPTDDQQDTETPLAASTRYPGYSPQGRNHKRSADEPTQAPTQEPQHLLPTLSQAYPVPKAPEVPGPAWISFTQHLQWLPSRQ